MTTGSWCLTEILMSRKPCSSNSEHSHSADSTSASAVALPYFSSSRLSSEPALTPIRIGVPVSDARRAISLTWSSNLRMLPGLTRTAAQPASIAANTYFGWKWMSAMTGICDFFAIAGSASASSWDGTATRTIWQPDAVSSAICWRVAFTSAVSVVVIDWTDTGAPPPTGTLPTMSWRDLRRSASGTGGVAGMPRSTLIEDSIPSGVIGTVLILAQSHGRPTAHPDPYVRSLPNVHRIDDVRQDEHHPEEHQDQEDAEAYRDELAVVDKTRIGPAAHPGEPGPDPLPDHHRDVPAVHWQQRQQVEHPNEDVQRRDQQQHEADLVLPAHVRRHRLPGLPGGADNAAHVAGGGL